MRPQDLGSACETSKRFHQILASPEFAIRCIKKAAISCPLTIDTAALHTRSDRDAALWTLRLGESLPPPSTWLTVAVATEFANPRFKVHQGHGAWQCVGNGYSYTEGEERFCLSLTVEREVPPPPGLLRFAQQIKISSRPTGGESGPDIEQQVVVDSELADVARGFEAFLMNMGERGLLFGCWPSGRVRVWAIDSDIVPWKVDVAFDQDVKAGMRHPIVLSETDVAILARDNDGKIGLSVAMQATEASHALATVTPPARF